MTVMIHQNSFCILLYLYWLSMSFEMVYYIECGALSIYQQFTWTTNTIIMLGELPPLQPPPPPSYTTELYTLHDRPQH